MTEAVFLVMFVYVLMLFALSRRQSRRRPRGRGADDFFFVFTIPCLNEERVIGATLDSLLALPQRNFAILVIDDASNDGTASVVRAYDPERVWFVQRTPPRARRGKGDALNAAYFYLLHSGRLVSRDRDRVIVSVFDADGRLDASALEVVSRYFDDEAVGAVQIAVNMRNADENLLARLQDVEFTVFTEIFQKARQRLGSVGLGGNGQFVRFSALASLGARPWSHCLTEDLDLGVRLLLSGWKNAYCGYVAVSQQAVTTTRAWLRQRARWFHGHVQCWRLIPRILRSQLDMRTMSDMIWYLTLPAAILLTPLMVLPLLISIVVLTATAPDQMLAFLTARHGLVFALLYVFMFAPAYLYAYAYWSSRKAPFLRSLTLAHAFEFYAYLWFAAGWMAVARVVRGKRGWTKTARVAETEQRSRTSPRLPSASRVTSAVGRTPG